MKRTSIAVEILRWLVLLVIVTSCTRSPAEKKARHLQRGDQYYSQQRYREAVIEYRNALRIDNDNAHAIQRLGLSYYQLGELGPSFPFLLKTKELRPDDTESRLKLGTMYLAGRKSAEAREEATFILDRDPKNLDALLLWAGSAETPQEVSAAVERLEQAQADFGERAKPYLALGALYLRKQDADKAEQAFKRAVTVEPKSIEAHTLLGNFYLARRDTANAEREFKAAAAIAPAGSPTRVTLADFYLLLNRGEDAIQVLTDINTQAPDFLPAWRRTAQVALAQKRYDDSIKAIDVILKKNPEDVDGRLLRGQVHLARRETSEAIDEFQRVLRQEPKSAPARYQLALARLQAGNVDQAKMELQEAKNNAPGFVDAQLLLAELNIRTGNTDPAIEELEALIEKQPKIARAYVLLGGAYLAKKRAAEATETYRQFARLVPESAQGPYLVGLGLLNQGMNREARAAFNDAVTTAPGFVEPLAQLVALDMKEKRSEDALARVKKQVDLNPQSVGLQMLLGRVYLARGEGTQAEQAFLKAIELNPQLFDPYVALGGFYAQTKRYDEALEKLEQARKVNAQNLGVHMLVGMIHEMRKDIPQAQAAYEKVLELNPRFGPAANNLAYIYSEHGGDKEKALQLAQTAKEVLPEDPRVSDTLGWILYKRGVYERAVTLLRESAEKLNDNAEVHYHLGMAYLKVGNTQAAKETLTKALKLGDSFTEVEEAKRALASLQ
jgi:tetratricopeptide (TPR) repeat protein